MALMEQCVVGIGYYSSGSSANLTSSESLSPGPCDQKVRVLPQWVDHYSAELVDPPWARWYPSVDILWVEDISDITSTQITTSQAKIEDTVLVVSEELNKPEGCAAAAFRNPVLSVNSSESPEKTISSTGRRSPVQREVW